MGFKTKIFLLAIIAALIGYIWYFNVAWDFLTIFFTAAIVCTCIIDWGMDSSSKPHSFKTKFILFAILAAVIFYVWYFNVPLNQGVIFFLALLVWAFVLGLLASSYDNAHHNNYIRRQ